MEVLSIIMTDQRFRCEIEKSFSLSVSLGTAASANVGKPLPLCILQPSYKCNSFALRCSCSNRVLVYNILYYADTDFSRESVKEKKTVRPNRVLGGIFLKNVSFCFS